MLFQSSLYNSCWVYRKANRFIILEISDLQSDLNEDSPRYIFDFKKRWQDLGLWHLIKICCFRLCSSYPWNFFTNHCQFYKLCYLHSCEIVSLHRDFAHDWIIECWYKNKSKTYKSIQHIQKDALKSCGQKWNRSEEAFSSLKYTYLKLPPLHIHHWVYFSFDDSKVFLLFI